MYGTGGFFSNDIVAAEYALLLSETSSILPAAATLGEEYKVVAVAALLRGLAVANRGVLPDEP